jgi:hypothetical protein
MKTRLALLLCVIAVTGYAQSPGTFTATAIMNVNRSGHTATLLRNGKVLIAGGNSRAGGHPVTSAELYDPSTGKFTLTGEMIAIEEGHSAIPLPDGRVLIVGGSDGRTTYGTSAEIYDPDTGTFDATGKPVAPIALGVLLGNGKVFLMGSAPRIAQINAQIYDPLGGTFAAIDQPSGTDDPLFQIGEVNALTLLADGRVLITGINCCATAAVLYDPTTGRFSLTDSRSGQLQTATLLMDGNVLFTGAFDGGAPDNEAEVYTTSTGAFSQVGRTTDSWRGGTPATLLPDGTVLLTGGDFSDDFLSIGILASAELYNPAAGLFSPAGYMTTARVAHTATLLPDGTVLITGGISSSDTAVVSAEIYKPTVLVPAPVLFSLSGDGRGQGAIWHAQTGELASLQNPAVAREILAMYTTGLGDGSVIPPQVAIGGRFAEILYFGDAPGYPGYFQVNFRVPGGVAPGVAVSVRLSYLARHSNQVTIAVQ